MPLGTPVVPDVYITVARSPMRTASCRCRTTVLDTSVARPSSSCRVINSPARSAWGSMVTTHFKSGSDTRFFCRFCSCSRPETITVPTLAWRRM